MKIIKIISEWKKKPKNISADGKTNRGVERGEKMVMAIVDLEYGRVTRHIAVSK